MENSNHNNNYNSECKLFPFYQLICWYFSNNYQFHINLRLIILCSYHLKMYYLNFVTYTKYLIIYYLFVSYFHFVLFCNARLIWRTSNFISSVIFYILRIFDDFLFLKFFLFIARNRYTKINFHDFKTNNKF